MAFQTSRQKTLFSSSHTMDEEFEDATDTSLVDELLAELENCRQLLKDALASNKKLEKEKEALELRLRNITSEYSNTANFTPSSAGLFRLPLFVHSERLKQKQSASSNLNTPSSFTPSSARQPDFREQLLAQPECLKQMQSASSKEVESFHDMDLKEPLLMDLEAHGFKKPTAIQQKAIIPCIRGLNVRIQALPGGGKTVCCIIAVLQRIDINLKECQAVILASTRESALDIKNIVESLGLVLNIRCLACVGGTDVRGDLKKLESGPHVVVGTPGRVCDMISRNALSKKCINTIVLDEVDEMFLRGLNDQIYDVVKPLHCGVQVILSYSSWSDDLTAFSQKIEKTFECISVENEAWNFGGINQFFINAVKAEWKLELLCNLCETFSTMQAVIFCNTRRCVDQLAEKMPKETFNVGAVHGGMDQRLKDTILKKFAAGSCKTLITTDPVARSIDIHPKVLVINFDLPSIRENYYRRTIGRGGCFDRKGVVINFVTDSDKHVLKEIETLYKTTIRDMPPNVTDLF